MRAKLNILLIAIASVAISTGLEQSVLAQTPVELEFSSVVGGTVTDKDGEGTGFTSVQPNAAGDQYQPARINLNPGGGVLNLTATQGSITSSNSLKNGLQLPVDATRPFVVRARLKGPLTNLTRAYQQGGIYFGSNQNNFVKFVIINSSSGTGGLGLQFYQEQNGVGENVGGGNGPQVTGLNWANITTLDLIITGDPATGVLSASYRVNSDTSAPIVLSQKFEPTANFFDDEASSRAGILGYTVNAPNINLVYSNFAIEYPSVSALGNLKVTTADASIVPGRLVFSTVNEEVRSAKTVTLTNNGSGSLTITGLDLDDSREKANAVRTADHERAADFNLINPPGLPFTIGAGASRTLSVQFAPLRVSSISSTATHTLNGENYASLTISSDDAGQPNTVVDLAGINFANYEGNNEPSVAEMARTFGWTLNIATESNVLGGAKKLLGDEVYSPNWVRFDTTKPVLHWPLAVTSGRSDNPHGTSSWSAKTGSGGNSGTVYNFAGRNNDDSPNGNEVLGSNNLSGGENQKLLPKILVNNVNSVPTSGTVDFTPSTAFALNTNGSFTDDARNGTGQLHNWRLFPVRDQQGTLIPHNWFAAADPGNAESGGKNYDYNDEVYLMTNARPESAALDPSVGALFPGVPELVFDFDTTYSGTLADKDGQGTGFTSTQLNKNDGYTATNSFNSSLIDINPSAGTLTLTTTGGSNASTNNTLTNGLLRTFDGRVGKFAVSTNLRGPLSNLTTPNRQGGVMLGPDQDNYVKLVATAQGSGLGVQFFWEKKASGATVGSIVPISNPSTLTSLELRLVGDPRSATVRAAYRAMYENGTDTGLVFLPGTVQLTGGQIGHYFAARSKAGLITSHINATATSVVFDRFRIISAETTANRTALYRLDVAGDSYTDTDGNDWDSDAGFFTPASAIEENSGNPPASIANTADDTLYQTYRAFVGNVPLESRVLTYRLPISGSGPVDLRLHFAEVFWGNPTRNSNGGIGKRIFDVKVEGKTVLENFDITAATGGALKAVIVPIEGIQVNDGELTLEFKAEVDYGAISAIEVLRP